MLGQFDIQLEYKPAADMMVPDALSRCKVVFDPTTESPDEVIPHFPYLSQKAGNVKLSEGVDEGLDCSRQMYS